MISNCLSCDESIEVDMDFNTLGNKIICSKCNYEMIIQYDEFFTEDDIEGWFYLESI